MKSRELIVTVGLVALALGGCAKDGAKKDAGHWVQAAPASHSQVGYLVAAGEGSRKSVDDLLAKTGGTARVLDEKQGRFEVFGVNADSITQALPNAEVRKNMYFDHLIEQDAAPAPRQTDPWFAECQAATSKLLAPIVAVRGNGNTLQFGNAAVSFAIDGPATNEYRWRVHGPRQFVLAGVSPGIAFNAPLPGGYVVDIIAKNALHYCSQSTFVLQVTWKVPFLGRKLPLPVTIGDLTAVSHLDAIGALEAWQKTRGDNVKIAVIDTGVNYNHPDLAPNMADEIGWDFVAGDNMPYDDNEHGTHVAGLAAGARYGVAPHARILAVKALNAAGGGDVGSIEQGIRYAVDHNSAIIVMSLGKADDTFRSVLQPAIAYAESRGVLVVIAAGNEASDNDAVPFYPASLSNSNILTVAATTTGGLLEPYSNFGLRSVMVGAPGGDVKGGLWAPDFLRTVDGGFVQLSGTSMATPVTAGVAALVKSLNPTANAMQLKAAILGTAVPKLGLFGRTSTGAMVNAKLAVGLR